MVGTENGYLLVQKPLRNQIIISLPQTANTVTNTLMPIADRKQSLTEAEELALLTIVMSMVEKEEKKEE